MMKAEGAAAAYWSELHGDLLDQILQKLRCLSLCDYLRFGAVCTNWRRIQITNYNDHDDDNEHIIKLPSQLPVLLIPNPCPSLSPAIIAAQQHQERMDALAFEDPNGEVETITTRYYSPKDTLWIGQDITRLEKPSRTFYSLTTRKVHTDIQLHVPHFFNCRGSSHGWLIVVREDKNFSIRLLNPFRSVNNEIQLPPFTTIDDVTDLDDPIYGSHCLNKAYVSANPSSVSNQADLVVMTTYYMYKPAFCRPGDAFWTCLEMRHMNIADAIYYKGQFYSIEHWGESTIYAFDVSLFHHDGHPFPKDKVTRISGLPVNIRNYFVHKAYVVECGGDLLQVRRDIDDGDGSGYRTTGFQVLKFDLDPSSSSEANSNKWVELSTLDGYSLFLGNNGSMSVLASDFPPGCCKPNRIYFTDDHEEGFLATPSNGPKDMGVFSLEDGSIEPHYQIDSKTIMPNAIWIQPML